MAPPTDAVTSGGLRPSQEAQRKMSLMPDESVMRKMSVVNPDMNHLLHEAKEATNAEKSMTIRQAFRTYPKAVLFSMILSTAIIST